MKTGTPAPSFHGNRVVVIPRLYPILDTAALARGGLDLVEAAGAMLEGGARILQFRHKGHFSQTVFDDAGKIAALCREAGALYIIDDRPDVAKLLGAGVHLGQRDLPPAAARRILGPEPAIGFSNHNEKQLRAAAAEPVDYLALGPVFPTGSKQNPDPVVGVEGLHRWRRLTDQPLVAIGGITRENARKVLAAGADSVAVISDLWPARLDGASLRQRIEEWMNLLA